MVQCYEEGENLDDKLEELILKHRNKKFVVIEPGGNNGDLLIYMGMEKKLKELGISGRFFQYQEKEKAHAQSLMYGAWRTIIKVLSVASKLSKGLDIALRRLDNEAYEQTLRAGKIQFDPEAVILIQGGANVNDIWGWGTRLLKNVIRHNPENIIIVGPQSYWFRETNFLKLFLKAKQDIYLFCRERYSYNLLRSISFPQNVHVGLSQDTAFYLSRKSFHPSEGNYDLICFRTDKESISSQKTIYLPRSEVISFCQSENRVVAGDISNLCDYSDFVKLIEESRKVITDRAHVAILATILGKDTTLYPNSYYKNKGIYEYSLSCYPNIKFADSQRNSKEFELTVNLLLTAVSSLNSNISTILKR